MRRHYMIYTIGLLFLLCGLSSCSEDFLAEDGPELNGLVMQLQIDGNPASVASSRVTADPTLRENVVEHVDVFFSSDGTNIDYYRHATLGTDNRLVLAGADWKDKFPATSYTVYVLANKHDYEDTDNYLSAIKTVDELKQLTDTDAEVNKAEGERSGETTYSGKLFFMDGKTTWTPPTDAIDETIEVELYRAAAKFVVNIGFQSTDEFNLDDISITGVQKKVVNYMPEAMALAEMTPDYETMDAVTGDASGSGMSNTNYTNGKSGEERKDILYAYAYPNAWGDDAKRETYILINVPYSENDEYHNNYYKVPIRISNDANELQIDRNTQYTVNVTIDRKGNEVIDEPLPLKPTFNVAEWKSEEIQVDDDTPSYLVLSHDYIEMHNVADTTITFFSSDELKSVQIMDAYFINKDGDRQDEQATRWHTNYGGEIVIDDSRDVSSYCEIEDWTENALQGNIKYHGEVPTNVTARYVTLRVTSNDPDLNPNYKDVTIVQYPLEYISGAPGVYSTRDDFEGNTYYNYKNQIQLSEEPQVYIGDERTTGFHSKVYYDGGEWGRNEGIYQVTVVSENIGSMWRPNYVYHLSRSNSAESDNPNNRMYIVQITSSSNQYTVARPAITGTGNDIVTANTDENNRLVSPAFMLASQLGTVRPMDWDDAQEHCKQYVEVIDYGNNEIHEFKDWRLPTYDELRVIGKYQNEQPEVMAEVLGGDYYWSAREDRAWEYEDPDAENPKPHTNNSYIRCIRDVSPEDLSEFRAHNIR